MMEGLGLSGMTETPLVVVDTQRGGPSTGLPTKQEQSDLFAMLYGTHGEIPKVVIAPSTGEEAFYDTVQAFNIADELQLPVILLSDLQLSLGKQTVEPFDYKKVSIKRGKLNLDELPELEDKQYFKRYEVTEDGVSTRVVPGQKYGIHHVTGVEHSEIGTPSEAPTNRVAQMDKRFRKLNYVNFEMPIYTDAPHEEADVLIVGFGSTRGAIEEIRPVLDAQGIKANHAHVRLISPFPSEELLTEMNKAKKVIVVENNATGQLASIIKLNVGQHQKTVSLTKYDGTPFLPNELLGRVKELLTDGNI